MDSTVQRRDESDLAYEYFKLSRDTDRDKRSLRVLCGRDVYGKKRSWLYLVSSICYTAHIGSMKTVTG